MNKFMVDANVLILASKDPDAYIGEMADKIRACAALIGGRPDAEPHIPVSSIAWAEFLRGVEAAKRYSVAEGFFIHAFDARAAVRGAEILSEFRSMPESCSKCLYVADAKTCSTCGNQSSKKDKMLDSLILGHAEVLAEIDTLYSFDTDMLRMGKLANSVVVKEPPSYFGDIVRSRPILELARLGEAAILRPAADSDSETVWEAIAVEAETPTDIRKALRRRTKNQELGDPQSSHARKKRR